MDVAILVALIAVNALFAMAEVALLTAKRSKLQRMVDAGDHRAAAALELGEDPNRFLSTVQVGITTIGILNGVVAESALAAPVALWLERTGVSPDTSGILASTLIVVIITYLTIVLGELVPKRIGQSNPEPIARIVARPMLALAKIARPLVLLLSGSTKLLLRLAGIRQSGAPVVTEEEIHALLEEGSDAGIIEENERQMVRNVFRLDDRQITSLMVPRGDIISLDLEEPLNENLQRIQASEHSRFPVCIGGFDEVVGIINAKVLLAQTLRGETPDFKTDLQPAVFVPESLTGMELLEHFKSSGVQMAFVIDEYGEIQGLITLQDLIEAIAGEFKPDDHEDAWAIQRQDGTWLLDGIIPVPELKDTLGLDTVPEEDKGRYNTLSGMLMLLMGRIPRAGERVEWENWRFEIVDMDGKRIDKVLASQQDLASIPVSSDS
ncbi:MAG: HlyC/CorC family transporter [Rhodocyclaceae bacterium]|jgi:putative hemolysin|nr:HlyC/CorC family transporter [Rhodocyclaceae bacterium]